MANKRRCPYCRKYNKPEEALKVVKEVGYKKAVKLLGIDKTDLYRWQHEMRLANVKI